MVEAGWGSRSGLLFILRVFAQIGRVFYGLLDSVTNSFEGGVVCFCTIFDE
jgi:hypothetical protein